MHPQIDLIIIFTVLIIILYMMCFVEYCGFYSWLLIGKD